MPRGQENWIPLINYSTKYGVSLSTLRRRIKTGAIRNKFENGKYFVADDANQSSFEMDLKVSAQPTPVTVPAKTLDLGLAGVELPSAAPATPNSGVIQESIFTTANRIIEDLKSAYTKILSQQEEQISILKEEIADLRTLARVLEDQLQSSQTEKEMLLVAVEKLGGPNFAGSIRGQALASAQGEEVSQARPMVQGAPVRSYYEESRGGLFPMDLFGEGSEETDPMHLHDQITNKKVQANFEPNDWTQTKPAGAAQAARASVVGSQAEEFFFDNDEAPPVTPRSRIYQGNKLPDLNLEDIQIPDDFKLEFNF